MASRPPSVMTARVLFYIVVFLALYWFLRGCYVASRHHVSRPRRSAIDPHNALHNTWYQMVNLTARRIGFNDSCSRENPTMTAVPINMTETICLLHAYTLQRMPTQNCTIPHCCSSSHHLSRHWTLPANYSYTTNKTVAQGLHLLRLTGKDSFCFSMPCCRQTFTLGHSLCEDVIPLNGYNMNSQRSHRLLTKPELSGIAYLNLTYLSIELTGSPYYPPWNFSDHLLEVPSPRGMGTPDGYIWKCGNTLYLYLPKDWCGTCSLARLQPSSYVFSEEGVRLTTLELKKREFKPVQAYVPFSANSGRTPLYNDFYGLLFTIFPNFGTASLMHRMNEVWWSLENITSILTDVTALLANDPEKQAMRTMLMQHQLALDSLFASRGGLCTVIGEHCCTYLPSTRGNWTLIHDRVKNLGDFLKARESAAYSWDLMTWLTSGSWFNILMKFLMPFVVFFLLIFIFAGCVIPCARSMMTKTMTNVMIQHFFMMQKEEAVTD